MVRDLQHFVDLLDHTGQLARISRPVDPVLEIAKQTDAESKSPAPIQASSKSMETDPEFARLGGRALLFEKPIESDFPLLINAFGSYRRIKLAFADRSLEEIAEQIASLVKPEPPRSIREAISAARRFAPLLKIGPKRLRSAGPCQQVIQLGDEVDLTRLPVLKCWPLDGDLEAVGYPQGINDAVPGLGHPKIDNQIWNERFRGRFITLAGIHTIHADDRDDPKPKSHNIGMYRIQLLGKNRVAMHWHMHHDGAAHWRSWKKLGQPMPVAIVLGGPPVLPYAATCPLPPGISELLMAGFLQGKGLRLCRAKTVPLWVPADAEMVIEGSVSTQAGYPGYDPREPDAAPLGDGAVFEGPFGDHTGFYSMPDRYPLMKVSAFTHRRNAIYPTTIVGLPPQEDYFLGKATERIMRPLLQTILPDLLDYDLPMYGAFHNVANLQITKHYPLHARKVMHAVWGAGQMAWTKNLFVVDHDVDVHDLTAVLGALYRYCKPSRDIEKVHGALDILDHAAPRLGSGMKLGFDATRKIPGEDLDDQSIDPIVNLPTEQERARAVEQACDLEGVLDAAAPEQAPGWLFIRADRGLDEPDRVGLGQRILDQLFEHGSSMKFIVVLARGVEIHDHHRALFHWAANTDASRDAVWDHSQGCDRIGFDATPKTPGDARNRQPVRVWPPVLPGL